MLETKELKAIGMNLFRRRSEFPRDQRCTTCKAVLITLVVYGVHY